MFCRFEEGNPSSYATVVITNTGADYTKLGLHPFAHCQP